MLPSKRKKMVVERPTTTTTPDARRAMTVGEVKLARRKVLR